MIRRILITGGFGYLGGRLAWYLDSLKDYEVLLGSRRVNQPPDWLPNGRVVQTIWDSPDSLESICSGVDTIVHLAGMNAEDCSASPALALEVNGVATARLVQAAIRQKVKRFIYLSTIHVYGSPLTGVISEETCPTPVHPYAFSHRAGEDVVWSSHRSGKIEGIVVRLSNAYGAPVGKDVNCWMLLVNDLCRQAVISKKLVLRTSGLQRRDFIPLRDVVRAISHLFDLPVDSCGSGLFNLGGEASCQIIEIAELIAMRCHTVLGYKPEIERPEPKPEEGSHKLKFQIEKIKETGFHLKGKVEEEIDATLEFCVQAFG